MHIHDTSACLKLFPGDIGTRLSWTNTWNIWYRVVSN